MGTHNNNNFKVLGSEALDKFATKHADSSEHLKSLRAELKAGKWETPHQLKESYPSVSVLKSGNIIFNICGNSYRLWTKISFKNKIISVVKIGTHKEYDKWTIQ